MALLLKEMQHFRRLQGQDEFLGGSKGVMTFSNNLDLKKINGAIPKKCKESIKNSCDDSPEDLPPFSRL